MSSFDCKLLQFYKLTLAGKNDKIGFNDSYFHTSLIGFAPNGFLFLLNPIKKAGGQGIKDTIQAIENAGYTYEIESDDREE
ncbi:hypothetical protein DWY89_07025 [Clostridium sp. AF27-5AA]|nr:hypothetical protein DWY89_07025 [Clostridium sp. AF27-5AA]